MLFVIHHLAGIYVYIYVSLSIRYKAQELSYGAGGLGICTGSINLIPLILLLNTCYLIILAPN